MGSDSPDASASSGLPAGWARLAVLVVAACYVYMFISIASQRGLTTEPLILVIPIILLPFGISLLAIWGRGWRNVFVLALALGLACLGLQLVEWNGSIVHPASDEAGWGILMYSLALSFLALVALALFGAVLLAVKVVRDRRRK